MAKKKTATKVAKEVVEQSTEVIAETVAETIVEPAVVPQKTIAKKETKPSWEIKDRVYYLAGNKKPLSRSIKSSGIYWFDEEKGYERELKYCENQRTPFVDEMKGDQRLAHIVFRNGALYVEKSKTVLQKLL